MSFNDLDELLGSAKKELPIGGRMVAFPDRVSANTGLILLRISQRVQADPTAADTPYKLAADLLDDDGWQAVQDEIMGRTPEELVAEGLTGDRAAHVFKTLIAWHVFGREAAEKAWALVGNPPAPNRASRRATATTTRPRGSTSGTTTRKPAAKKASAGKSSSPASP